MVTGILCDRFADPSSFPLISMEDISKDREPEAAPTSKGTEQPTDRSVATVEELLAGFAELNQRLIDADKDDEEGMVIGGNEDE